MTSTEERPSAFPDLCNEFDLDREQRDVVRSFVDGNNVLVEAPPGTGKTYLGAVLCIATLRFNLLPSHSSVLFLTFSRNARVQIENQLARFKSEKKIWSEEERRLKISNYHSLFFECIRERKGLWGAKNKLRVGSLKARRERVKQALNSLAMSFGGTDDLFAEPATQPPHGKPSNREADDSKNLTSAFALHRFPAKTLFASEKEYDQASITEAYGVARDSLQRGMIHYDDFAPLMLDLIESSRSFLLYLRIKYPILILDEYQDTDLLQWEILKLWNPPRLAVFYDSFQMIY